MKSSISVSDVWKQAAYLHGYHRRFCVLKNWLVCLVWRSVKLFIFIAGDSLFDTSFLRSWGTHISVHQRSCCRSPASMRGRRRHSIHVFAMLTLSWTRAYIDPWLVLKSSQTFYLRRDQYSSAKNRTKYGRTRVSGTNWLFGQLVALFG